MPLVNKSLVERFNLGRTVPGTRSSHHFVPSSTFTITRYLTSEDTNAVAVFSFNSSPEARWWVGLVEKISEKQGDFDVKFLHPHGLRILLRKVSGKDYENTVCAVGRFHQ
ncbi:unnamed protein product [Lepeophtheirus salmonis]|uniref:(salmon louse) hypothetical protein n=1 Tax=Lepeophtheirus salmonis TaxID=72036 RepID=A0A7R8H3F3_LEPSM|nr:unnamed protein product [Lepeophtheirus salmonis]CAF2828954.1 unnamed protein product [Lepeophtheirus salmonis]